MKSNSKKFKITTLGCKVNQSESESIARQLADSDMTQVGADEQADIFIINTCTVTGKASMQSRQAVRQAIRSNPRADIVVTGCYAQTAPEEIRQIEGINTIVGHGEKHRIAEMVGSNNCRRCESPESACREHRFQQMPALGYGNRARPVLKIQDGCNALCTYCIVPSARGPSRSLTVEAAIEGITQLENAGYQEVVLTGIHLGCYGHDLNPPSDLLSLLKRIRDTRTIDRIRLSSIEPCEISSELIRFVAQTDSETARICPHFHIPLQSGDNDILRKMHRPYTREFFRRLVREIHRHVPNAALGVDVLIGFPGETEGAFKRTYSLIQELPVTYLHVFPFSPRKGTAAYNYPDRIPAAVVQQRCRKMRQIGNIKKSEFYNKFINKTLEVLIESNNTYFDGYVKGTSSNYIPVLVQSDPNLINSIIQVKVQQVDAKLNVIANPL
jgi:threonylcarbamoyladenosine tRNA methylthiotransferase MtaB